MEEPQPTPPELPLVLKPLGGTPAGTLALIQMRLQQLAHAPVLDSTLNPTGTGGLVALEAEELANLRTLLGWLCANGGGLQPELVE